MEYVVFLSNHRMVTIKFVNKETNWRMLRNTLANLLSPIANGYIAFWMGN